MVDDRTHADCEKSHHQPQRLNERLIVQTAFLGDVLLAIPLIKEILKTWPEDRLTILVRKGVGAFLRDAALGVEVIEVDKSSSVSWREVRLALRSRSFELILCPHESFRSALFVARLRGKLKVGFAKWFNNFVFDVRIDRPMDLPESLRQLSLLESVNADWSTRLADFRSQQVALGGQGPEKGSLVAVPVGLEMTVPRLKDIRSAFESGGDWNSKLSPRAHDLAAQLGVGVKPLVAIAPGSVWPTKMWTKEGFTEVARAWTLRGARVVVLGAPSEAALAQEIASQVSGVISMAGETSLYESAELLALAELLICNDSGSMHLGSCAGTPTVSVFGPTVLELGYRPWNPRARVVQIPLDCRPCGKHGAKKCPLGTHACMKGISSQAVITASQQLREVQNEKV